VLRVERRAGPRGYKPGVRPDAARGKTGLLRAIRTGRRTREALCRPGVARGSDGRTRRRRSHTGPTPNCAPSPGEYRLGSMGSRSLPDAELLTDNRERDGWVSGQLARPAHPRSRGRLGEAAGHYGVVRGQGPIAREIAAHRPQITGPRSRQPAWSPWSRLDRYRPAGRRCNRTRACGVPPATRQNQSDPSPPGAQAPHECDPRQLPARPLPSKSRGAAVDPALRRCAESRSRSSEGPNVPRSERRVLAHADPMPRSLNWPWSLRRAGGTVAGGAVVIWSCGDVGAYSA
jgi:hypothetical protein